MAQPTNEPKPTQAEQIQEYLETAQRVRTGEYFREARNMYDFTVHNPMAERYMYLLVMAIAVIIFLIAQAAISGLYPLHAPIPLIVSTADPYEDLPRLKSLLAEHGEEPTEAVLRFMTRQYVITREQYDIATFDRDINAIRSESSPEVFEAFETLIDPHNPDSPITLYQRHSKRKITVLSSKHVPDGMEVNFEAAVEGKNETKTSRWRANIAFEYSKVELDKKTDKIKHVTFVVTGYKVKRLQDVK